MTRSLSFRKPALFALVALGSITFAHAQQPTTPKPGDKKTEVGEEIEVVRAYEPVLAEAVKIRRSPNLENSKPFKANLVYNVPDLKLDLNADIKKLQAQSMADERENMLRNNYVALGAGMLNTGIGEVYLNTGKDEALQAGGFFRHLNQEGSVSGNFSREQAGVYGRSIRTGMQLNGDLGFQRTAYSFYGVDPALATQPAIEKQHYNVLTLNGSANSRETTDVNKIDFNADAHAHLLKNAFEGSESSFALGAGAGKRAGSFYFGARAGVDMTGTSDKAYDISNVILNANPYVSYRGDKFNLKAGIGIFRETYQSRTNILPDVSAEVELIPGFATIYGGYTGQVLKTSLFDLSEENRYLNENVAIRNALVKKLISGGIKGNAGSGLGYKVGVTYKTVEDLPLFVNNAANIRKFDVVYDESTDIIGFEGEVSIKAPGVFRLIGKVTASDYSLSTEEYAWSKPNLQIWSNASFFINGKLTINGEVLMSSGARVRTPSALSPTGTIATRLEAFTDLSAGAEYRIKEKVGVFVRVNNLLNQKYQRFQYYPVNGLNAFGGLNYSF